MAGRLGRKARGNALAGPDACSAERSAGGAAPASAGGQAPPRNARGDALAGPDRGGGASVRSRRRPRECCLASAGSAENQPPKALPIEEFIEERRRGEMMLLARLLLVATTANAWQRWEYEADATQQWKELWGLERGPGARRGHSLVLHHKPATDTEKATTKIVLFGGRSNEIFKQHVPKTSEIKISSGTIDFVSYDKSPIKTEMCTTNDQGEQVCRNPINVGLYFNDVWAYELDCHREGTTAADTFCGGVFGGVRCAVDDDCKDQNFKECTLSTFGATANYDPQTGSGPCPSATENANKKSWACLE